MKKKLALILTLALVFTLASACGKDPTPNDDGETIKIGHIVDKTGAEAMTGEAAEQSLQFALDQMGGEIGGRKVEIVVADGGGNAETAAAEARRLVQDENVVAILGPTQIDEKITVAEYTADVHVPLIYYNTTPSAVMDLSGTVFSAGGGTAQFPTVMVDYLCNELHCDSIHVIAQDSAGGRNYTAPLLADFAAFGGTVASVQYVPAGTTDYTPYLSDLSDADALLAWVSGEDAVALWSAWYDTGVYEQMPMYALSHGGFTDHFICDELAESRPEVVSAMLEKGVYAPIAYTYTLSSSENTSFTEAWEQEFGVLPEGTNLPGATYAALKLLATAIENVDGEITSEKLCEAIQNADIVTPEGHLYFENGSRVAAKDVHIVKLVQLEDGSFNYDLQKTYSDVPATGLVYN